MFQLAIAIRVTMFMLIFKIYFSQYLSTLLLLNRLLDDIDFYAIASI